MAETNSKTGGKRILVKGYLRPDGVSYYVAIPKEVRTEMGLNGGEYFLVKANSDEQKIVLKLMDFTDQ